MKRTITTLLFVFAFAIFASANGLVTNVNQSASYLRNMARGTTLGADAGYYNPAGMVFMEKGWHFGINNQVAIQRRWTNSTFEPFSLAANNLGSSEKHFQGDTYSPVVPGLYATYKGDRWAYQASLTVGSGGGSVDYEDGLASFESIFAQIPVVFSQLDPVAHFVPYSMDIRFKVSSMTFTGRLGAAYRISDNFSAGAQLQFAYTSNNYEGDIKDVKLAENQEYFKDIVADKKLRCKQNGWAISPVFSLYFRSNGARDGEVLSEKATFGWGWSASAKYEFRSAITVKNNTSSDVVINGQGLFPDGQKSGGEIPALLSLAASKHLGSVKLTAQWMHYFDRDADNYYTQHNNVNGDADEIMFGVDWKVTRRLLLSTCIDRTFPQLDESTYSDFNFNAASTTWGIGAGVNVSRHVTINGGVMFTFYQTVNREANPYNSSILANIPGADQYHRQSTCFGVGVDLHF